jgi:hypothetical protein
MMSNYVIVVYVSFLSWHVHGSHSVCLPKPGVTRKAPNMERNHMRRQGSACTGTSPSSFPLSPNVPSSLFLARFVIFQANVIVTQREGI